MNHRTFTAAAITALVTGLTLSTAGTAAADPVVVDPGTCTTNILGGPAGECGGGGFIPDPGTCTTNVLGGPAGVCGTETSTATVHPHHRNLPHRYHHHRH